MQLSLGLGRRECKSLVLIPVHFHPHTAASFYAVHMRLDIGTHWGNVSWFAGLGITIGRNINI